MLAEIETNLRGITEKQTKTGKLYIYTCENQKRNGTPYMFDVLSRKNNRKVGTQKIKVVITNRRDKAGVVLAGFSIWEAD